MLGARIRLDGPTGAILDRTVALAPDAPFVTEIDLGRAVEPADLRLSIETADGRAILEHAPTPPIERPVPASATEPPPPRSIRTVEQLWLTGRHLEQYRHATRRPEPYWEEALRREERQRDALLLALEVLRDSVLAYQQEHVGRLASLAEATLIRLTNGRYSRVTLDGDFHPTLAMDGREVPLEALSRGARDGFYLALRAALARELAAREPLPLILDDPIAHFDEERRGVLLGFLEELCEEVQVILLTHDRRVLNHVREAHVLGVGTSGLSRESARKVEVRR
jgi:hypothetical protein